jgi:orotate phosphoribosyltransferase-like protein
MGISRELLKQIAELWNEGYTTGEIARKLNIPEVVVVRVTRRD